MVGGVLYMLRPQYGKRATSMVRRSWAHMAVGLSLHHKFWFAGVSEFRPRLCRRPRQLRLSFTRRMARALMKRATRLVMARVPVKRMRDLAAYEYFEGRRFLRTPSLDARH